MAGLISKIGYNIGASASKIGQRLKKLFPIRTKVDGSLLEALEEALICSDMGVAASKRLVNNLNQLGSCDLEELKRHLVDEMSAILKPVSAPIFIHPSDKPTAIVMCGVNGNGKTTTVGKLAHLYTSEGKKVVIAAADTFRAAAKEQVAIWAERSGCELISGKDKTDPASIAFRAMEHCCLHNRDILLIDTAGRLQNQVNFMKELQKITSVVKKCNPNAPHNTILVLDATTGQNALSQIAQFHEAVNITGLIITKLDGSAKGGVVLAIAHNYPSIKIHNVGCGEGIEDLNPFDPLTFAKAILDC